MTDHSTREKLTLIYDGFGDRIEVSLSRDDGLKADPTHEWLVSALRAVGFTSLAALVEGKVRADEQRNKQQSVCPEREV